MLTLLSQMSVNSKQHHQPSFYIVTIKLQVNIIAFNNMQHMLDTWIREWSPTEHSGEIVREGGRRRGRAERYT